MAKRIEQFNLGASCRQANIDDCIRKIDMIFENKLPEPMFEEYYHNHSINNLEIQLKSIIDLSS